jgi:hypothetical protein
MYISELFTRTKLSHIAAAHHIGAITIGAAAIAMTLQWEHQKDATLEYVMCFLWGKTITLWRRSIVFRPLTANRLVRCSRGVLSSRRGHQPPYASQRPQLPSQGIPRKHDRRRPEYPYRDHRCVLLLGMGVGSLVTRVQTCHTYATHSLQRSPAVGSVQFLRHVAE